MRAGKPGHFEPLLRTTAGLFEGVARIESGPENPDTKLSTGEKLIPWTSRTPSDRFTDASTALSGRLTAEVRTAMQITY